MIISIALAILLSSTTRDHLHPDKKYLIIGDGKKIKVEFCGCVEVMMQRAEDVAVTVRNVAFVAGMLFDLSSFNIIRVENVIALDHEGAQMLDGRVLVRSEKLGNFAVAT